MSANFYQLLKYAATGIASPDMTYYDRMRASTLMGGATIQTLTGQPPLSFLSDGSPITIWSMIGNGEQSGTPSPQSIIMPTFCGVRTGNLFDKVFTSGYHLATNGKPTGYTNDARCATLEPIDVSGVSTVTFSFTNMLRNDTKKYMYSLFDGLTLVNRVSNLGSGSTIDVSLGDELYLCVYSSLASVNASETTTDIMLNLGSTALPYEPYGYKIPVSCAGQTVPVYLGQTQTVRRIKKLVLTGEESWTSSSGGAFYALPITPYMLDRNGLLSTHFFVGNYSGALAIGQLRGSGTPSSTILFNYDNGVVGVDGFKSYLAAQYSAGTPVTVWYVLAEPKTSIVNEPLCKIGNYADELNSEDSGVTIPTTRGQNVLTVDTDLQPSSVSITGHIKLT